MLDTSSQKDPDLIIRTAGEQRLSNFLSWQSAYSEFYFSGLEWPEFNKTEFFKALESYKSRVRSFGAVAGE
jgi:undecaprenyl diphosphate synthase